MLTVDRIADLDLRRATGRPEAVLGDVYLHAAADDVTACAQPGALLELEPQRHCLREDSVGGRRQPGRLEHDQPDTGPARMRGEAAQRIVVPAAQPRRQVDHEQVDSPPGNQRSRQRPALGEVGRPENEQPAQIDTARRRLERVETAPQVEEGDDATARLGLGEAMQCQCRLATRTEAV